MHRQINTSKYSKKVEQKLCDHFFIISPGLPNLAANI